MSFFTDLFKKKEKTPVRQTPKTRADLESTLFVRYEEQGLNSAFTKSRTPQPEEQNRLKEVLDIIESVPDGKKLIEHVATAGYKINFDTFRGASAGACNPSEKRIMLCPANHSSDAAIAASLYHEMTHAMQNERSGGMLADCSKYAIADQIKFLRAAEASAWMEEAKFAYQIKDSHPEVLRHVGDVPMYKAFAAEMGRSNDTAKASEVAFKDWYGFKLYQAGYEDQHVSIIKNRARDRLKKQDNKAFKETLSPAEALKFTVISDDVKISPDFLTSPEAFSISADGAKALNAVAKGYSSKFMFATKDNSVQSMYSYDTGKPFSAAANSANKPTLMSSLTTISKQQATKKQAIVSAVQSKSR